MPATDIPMTTRIPTMPGIPMTTRIPTMPGIPMTTRIRTTGRTARVTTLPLSPALAPRNARMGPLRPPPWTTRPRDPCRC